MFAADYIVSIFQGISSIADRVRTRIQYVLIVALMAGLYIAFRAYDGESIWWWNTIKCIVPLLPVIVWLFVWSALRQIGQAPEVARELISERGDILRSFSKLNIEQVNSVRGAYTTLKSFREHEGLEEVMETISGIGLLINPIFALLSVLAFFCLFGLIVAAFLLMLV